MIRKFKKMKKEQEFFQAYRSHSSTKTYIKFKSLAQIDLEKKAGKEHQ